MDEYSKKSEWTREREVDAEQRATALHDLLEARDVQSRLIEIPNGVEYRRAIVLSHEARKSAEPLVRVYRGINHLDETILHQAPYALRTRENHDADVSLLEHAREQVEALTKSPTHENLIRYVDTVWPDVSDDEVRRLESDLESIEDEVLSGLPLRLSLVHTTFGHNGGFYTDTGIAPYISASSDVKEAAGYGGKGLMVLDVPISKIEALTGSSSGEVAIKGEIPAEYISAILLRESDSGRESGARQPTELAEALRVVSQDIPLTVLEDSVVDHEFSALRAKEREIDLAQHEQDVASIIDRRAKQVLLKFPDVRPSKAETERVEAGEQTDKYTASKRAIYDKLAERLEAAGRKRTDLEDFFVFKRDSDPGTFALRDVHYARTEVTDEMLAALRRLVIHEEGYRRARDEADRTP